MRAYFERLEAKQEVRQRTVLQLSGIPSMINKDGNPPYEVGWSEALYIEGYAIIQKDNRK